MKQIYSLLNDVNTSMEHYERTELTDIENAELKKAVKRITHKRGREHKAIASVACAALLVAAIGGVAFHGEVYATAKSIAWQIGSFMGIDKNLQNYTEVLNTSQTEKGYTITLNEVILDGNALIVSSTIKSEKKIAAPGLDATGDVYVNGKRSSDAAGGGSKLLDNYTEESVMTYQLKGIETGSKLDIEILYNQIGVEKDAVKGDWRFQFAADGTALAADTIHVGLNQSFNLPNGAIVSLDEYTSNNLGQKIYFTVSGVTGLKCAEYDLQLSGLDDLGKNVEFDMRSMNGDEGKGVFVTSGEGISETAKTLTLIPSAVKFPETNGRLSNDFSPVGEKFVIELK